MKTHEYNDIGGIENKINVKLPDDEYAPGDGLSVTQVNKNDAVLLAEKYGFDRDVNIVVSTATPFGGAILGAKRGETVKYEADGGSLRAKVVSIEVSPLFQEA